MAEPGFELSKPDIRVHAVNHSTIILSFRAESHSWDSLLCFRGKLCTEFWKKLEALESFGTYLIPKLRAAQIYLWFVKCIGLSNYRIQIIIILAYAHYKIKHWCHLPKIQTVPLPFTILCLSLNMMLGDLLSSTGWQQLEQREWGKWRNGTVILGALINISNKNVIETVKR